MPQYCERQSETIQLVKRVKSMRDVFAQVYSILFSSPIPKGKDRLEKYSNPEIGDTAKRFHGTELCQSSRRTATRASSV